MGGSGTAAVVVMQTPTQHSRAGGQLTTRRPVPSAYVCQQPVLHPACSLCCCILLDIRPALVVEVILDGGEQLEREAAALLTAGVHERLQCALYAISLHELDHR